MKLFLIGYMGCGKSTVGKELASIFNLPFYDTDQIIEKSQNRSIGEIFQDSGEEAFRKMENQTLVDIVDKYPSGVFATGGGLPCFADNMKIMNAGGYTVFIKCGVNLLYERLVKTQDRPIINDKSEHGLKNFIRSHLAQRKPYYNLAAIKVMGFDSPTKISNRIISRIKKL